MEAALAARTRMCAKATTKGDGVAKVVSIADEAHQSPSSMRIPRRGFSMQCIIDKQNRTC
jgi:hypothetical protein